MLHRANTTQIGSIRCVGLVSPGLATVCSVSPVKDEMLLQKLKVHAILGKHLYQLLARHLWSARTSNSSGVYGKPHTKRYGIK